MTDAYLLAISQNSAFNIPVRTIDVNIDNFFIFVVRRNEDGYDKIKDRNNQQIQIFLFERIINTIFYL
jgi:hypothetical protein